jgi:MarR family transcriptional regulator for hemolysin
MPDRQRLTTLQWRLVRDLGQISRRWRSRLDMRLAGFGLTEARWLPLLHLARWGDGRSQKELAATLGVEGPTLVRTLDWLEREGLVTRRPDPADRRAKTLHLSARAIALHAEIEREAAGVRADLLEGITEAELLACLAVLDRIAARLGAPPPPPAAEEEGGLHGHRAA